MKHLYLLLITLTIPAISLLGQPHGSYNPQLPVITAPQATLPMNHTEHQKLQITEEVKQHMEKQKMNSIESLAGDCIPLPDFGNEAETEHYAKAFNELANMISGRTRVNYRRAVYLVEDAYFGGRMSYMGFTDKINEAKKLCELEIKQSKLSNNTLTKQMVAFQYITDTIKVKQTGTEQTITHYPMKYDFEDYRGKEDLRNTFVSKLLHSNSGQCQSLPLFYLILTEAMGARANLALSPNHSFIKIKDSKENWINLELTSGIIVDDNFYVADGFIKTEALRNKAYLEPLSEKETIAYLLNLLAQGYIRKYGYDGFVESCVDSALEYYPNCIPINMVRANHSTSNFMYVVERLGFIPKNELPYYPQAYDLFLKMHESYKTIDELGYEDMPSEIYEEWLKRVEKEKLKPEHQQKIQFRQTIK